MSQSEICTTKSLDYYTNSRLELLPFIPKNVNKVLDVGCGVGNFSQALKEKFNFTVWGVEPHFESYLEAKNKLDYVFNQEWNDATDIGIEKFDCIFFNDVLEHLIDPHSALKVCRKFLNSNGYVVSSIPNILHFSTLWKILIEQDWKYEEAGILDKTHLRFFSKKSIVRMFEECELKVIDIQGINPNYGRKFNVFNFLSCYRLEDMKCRQYVVVAQLK